MVLESGQTVILTIKDNAGIRLEAAQYGLLTLHIGDAELTSEGLRDEIEQSYGYSAAAADLDRPGGQDSGVWVWTIPDGVNGRVWVHGDWLRTVAPGTAEAVAI